MTIYFYSRTDSWGDFSNFSLHGFELDGLYWPTVEHYFQAQKFAGHPLSKEIRTARSPRLAKILGRSTTHPLRKDWDKIRDEVMYRAVRRKFQCHPDLQVLLISTENETLVESAPHDYYWGCGSDGTGLNKLGRILMRVRAELQQHATAECDDPAIVK